VVEVIQGRSAGLAATTDGAGHYEITGVAPDSYNLRFSKDSYEAFTTTPFQVISAADKQVDVQLTPRHVSTGQIGGHVTAVVGGPVTGATVTLFAGPSSPLKTTTDANGAYLFQNLRPGSGYGLRVEQQGFISTELRNISLADGQSLN